MAAPLNIGAVGERTTYFGAFLIYYYTNGGKTIITGSLMSHKEQNQ